MVLLFQFATIFALLVALGQAQTKECPKANVCFAIDESGSVSVPDFARETLAVKSIAAELARFDPGSKFSAVGFSGTAELISSPTSNLAEFDKSLDANTQSGGGTSLAAGLNLCRDQLKGSQNPRFIVLITDGRDGGSPRGVDVQQTIKDEGITISTIGVGSNVDVADLRDVIASRPSLYTGAADFANLLVNLENVIAMLCKTCPRAHMCFALDESGSENRTEFALEQMTVKTIAAEIGSFDPGSTFAAVGFSSTAELISRPTADLVQFNNSIDRNTQSGGTTSLGAGLLLCAQILRSTPQPRIIVLITDGKDNTNPRGVRVHQQIKDSGTIISTIGVGRKIDVNELRNVIASRPELYTNPPNFKSLFADIEGTIEKLCTIGSPNTAKSVGV